MWPICVRGDLIALLIIQKKRRRKKRTAENVFSNPYLTETPIFCKFQEHVPKIWCLFLANNFKILDFFPKFIFESYLCY